MMSADRVSRRSVLWTAAVCAAAPVLDAFAEPDPQDHTLTALIDGSAMVHIPAGEFFMGSPNGNADERPVHRVRITRGFEMGKTEVTQAQWETVMSDAHTKPGTLVNTPDRAVVSPTPGRFKGPSLPVESVSWEDIQVFLKRLNDRNPGHVYRLPTEAEWEYACKAGGDEEFLTEKAWYKENSGDQTHPVATRQPNPWGLHDMIGNVAEWVQDLYSPEYYEHSPGADPKGPEVAPDTGAYRVFRGGCWFQASEYCRAALRSFDFPISRLNYVGFRVVRTPR